MSYSCVVVNYNDAEETERFIKSIYGYRSIHKIVVVDNCSTDHSLEIRKRYEDDHVVVLSSDKNGGYGYGNNVGIEYARNVLGDAHVIISNPDVFFTEDLAGRVISVLENDPTVAVVSALQNDINGVIHKHAWRIPSVITLIFSEMKRGKKRNLFDTCQYSDEYLHQGPIMEVDCVQGAFLAINTEYFAAVGKFDENMFLFYEETVLGIKMKKAGYRTVILTDVSYDHNHSHSIGKTFSGEITRYRLLVKSRLYLMKHYYRANVFQLLMAKIFREYRIFKMRVRRLLKK